MRIIIRNQRFHDQLVPKNIELAWFELHFVGAMGIKLDEFQSFFNLVSMDEMIGENLLLQVIFQIYSVGSYFFAYYFHVCLEIVEGDF